MKDNVMIEMPDFDKAFEYENSYYLTSDPSRLAKAVAHFEFFNMTMGLAGSIVECGVFKGASLVRLATYRSLLASAEAKQIIAFDMFGEFPKTATEEDELDRKKFTDQAGSQGIGKDQMLDVLARKGIADNVELVEGNILETLPRYVADNPQLRISLLNLDTDVYEPAKCILENLYERIVPGGILLLDDYAVHDGETRATDEFFEGKDVLIQRLPYAATPCFVVKD